MSDTLTGLPRPETPIYVNPAALAQSFLHATHPPLATASGPVPSLLYWKSRWWIYDTTTGWGPHDSKAIQRSIWQWSIGRTVNLERRDTIQTAPLTMSGYLVRDMVSALESLCYVSGLTQPSFLVPARDPLLTGVSPLRVVSFRNGLLPLDPLLSLAPTATPLDYARHLSPPTPNWFDNSTLPLDFTPGAQCPTWTSFLAQVSSNNPRWVALLQQWFGYCLLPDTSMERFLLQWGVTRGGKSTILSILEALIGPDRVTSSTLKRIGSKNDGASHLSSRLILMPDTGLSSLSDGHDSAEVLKSIIGNDTLTTEVKYEQPDPKSRIHAKVLITCNDLPNIPDAAQAISSKMLILPFEVSFLGREDLHLRSKLLSELPGIANWALQGAISLYRSGSFSVLPEAQARLLEFRELNNPISAFVQTCCEQSPTRWTPTQSIYTAYSQWSQARGHSTLAIAHFFRQLPAACGWPLRSEKRAELRGYWGISLKPGASDPETHSHT